MANDSIQNKLWSACNKMRQDPGTTGALQYIEQFSWLLFLKVYEEIENEYEAKAAFDGKSYTRNIDNSFRWSVWTGKENYITGPDLLEFVEKKLIPYLRSLSGNRTKEIISEIFNNTQNRMEDGYLLREVVDLMAGVDFFGDEDSFAVSSIYEGLFSRMKAADIKPLAEYHTPRVIARFMVEQVAPKIGQTVYDPCTGPAGFLTEAYILMKTQVKTVADNLKLQRDTFFGKELKSLPFILGMMNMILNGIATPNIRKMNTLSINLFNLAEKYNTILTNPPFSGKIKGVDSNFPYPAASTEVLFLQHCMRSLKANGQCAIIVPDGVLFEVDDRAYVNTRKELVESFNLFAIVRLPKGAFAPYAKDTSTNILFFNNQESTKNVWYYEVPLPKKLKSFSKSHPILYNHFDECISLFKDRKTSNNSWIIDKNSIVEENYNLDFSNPNKVKDYTVMMPDQVKEEYKKIHTEIGKLITGLSKQFSSIKKFMTIQKIPLGNMVIESKDVNSDKKFSKVFGVNNISGIEESQDKKFGDIAKYKIIKNDYLAYNPYRVNVGSIGLFDNDIGIISPAYVVFRVDTKELVPKFLLYYLKTAEGLHEINSKTRGSVRSSLKFEKLQRIEIPNISVEQQRGIVKKFESIINNNMRLTELSILLSDFIKRTPLESWE